MANINQIEVNGTIFNLEDAEIKDKINQFTDYYGSTNFGTNELSYEHAHTFIGDSVLIYTKNEGDNSGWEIALWGDTGNFRANKLDPSENTRTTLGYIPLSEYQTRNSYAYTTDKTLFNPVAGYSVNYLRMRRWGQVVEFQIRLTHTSAISVSATGRLTSNLTLGVLKDANWRPAQTAYLW